MIGGFRDSGVYKKAFKLAMEIFIIVKKNFQLRKNLNSPIN